MGFNMTNWSWEKYCNLTIKSTNETGLCELSVLIVFGEVHYFDSRYETNLRKT